MIDTRIATSFKGSFPISYIDVSNYLWLKNKYRIFSDIFLKLTRRNVFRKRTNKSWVILNCTNTGYKNSNISKIFA